jgi:hypothetical protein
MCSKTVEEMKEEETMEGLKDDEICNKVHPPYTAGSGRIPR